MCACGCVNQVAADADLKDLATKAFTSYVKSYSMQPNKAVFDLTSIPLDEFAEVCTRTHAHTHSHTVTHTYTHINTFMHTHVLT